LSIRESSRRMKNDSVKLEVKAKHGLFGNPKSSYVQFVSFSPVYPYGTVELSQPDEPNFKVNVHRLKHYFGEDVPKLVVPDL
nr:reverse transcriptase domain-containing protein [Tanacetum cinerariifolium]